MLAELPFGQLGNSLRVGQLEVMTVEPAELVEVEDGRGGCDALKGEGAREFGGSEGFGLNCP